MKPNGILKKSQRHSASTRESEIAEHRDSILSRVIHPDPEINTEPVTEVLPLPPQVDNQELPPNSRPVVGNRLKNSLELYNASPPQIPEATRTKPFRPQSRSRSTSSNKRDDRKSQSSRRRRSLAQQMSRSEESQQNSLLHEAATEHRRESPALLFNTQVNPSKKGHAIARGELFPPIHIPVAAEHGEILVNEVPPITDLRPYTMTVSAAIARNFEDIKSGKRFPEERRMIRHFQQQSQEEDTIETHDLSCLVSLDHVFINFLDEHPDDINADLDVDQKVLIASNGRIILVIGRTYSTCKKCIFGRQFITVMTDVNGNEILTFTGRQDCIRGSMQISIGEDDKVLGTIRQDFCDSTYKIRDHEGHLVYNVQGPCYGVCAPCVFWCCGEHHEILEDLVTEVGTVRKQWKSPFQTVNGLLGVSFPESFPTERKALCIGLLMLIEFQYYRRGGNGLFGAILGIMLLTMIILIVLKIQFKLI